MNRVLAAFLFALLCRTAVASDYLLPVFALSVQGERESLWSSEVYVTNPGPQPAIVRQGGFLPGARVGFPPCLSVVQPFLNVPPYSSAFWSSGSLGLGVGCPEWAIGGLVFSSDSDVFITSRIVNVPAGQDARSGELLHGLGQEVPAVPVAELPAAGGTFLLPGVAWHPNSCGPTAFDTNVFFANAGEHPVDATIALSPDSKEIVIEGKTVAAPFSVTVEPQTEIRLRVAGPDSPLTVCMQPTAGAFLVTTDGPLGVVASVIDRLSGDPRTVLPIPAR